VEATESFSGVAPLTMNPANEKKKKKEGGRKPRGASYPAAADTEADHPAPSHSQSVVRALWSAAIISGGKGKKKKGNEEAIPQNSSVSTVF